MSQNDVVAKYNRAEQETKRIRCSKIGKDVKFEM